MYSEEEIRKTLAAHIKGTEGIDGVVDQEKIISQLKYELYENISTKEMFGWTWIGSNYSKLKAHIGGSNLRVNK